VAHGVRKYCVQAHQSAFAVFARTLQVAPPLVHGARACQHAARVRVLLSALRAQLAAFAAARGGEERLQIVAVEICAAKHKHLLHVQRINLAAVWVRNGGVR
jgi:hypothetical protein